MSRSPFATFADRLSKKRTVNLNDNHGEYTGRRANQTKKLWAPTAYIYVFETRNVQVLKPGGV